MKPRILLQSIAAAVAVMAAGAASATPVYPDFTVSTAALGGGGTLGSFTANDIEGSYSELLTFDTSNNTFSVSLSFLAQDFDLVDTANSPQKTTYKPIQSGLDLNYGLLAIFNGSGTYVTSGSGTTFTLTPGGNLTLDYDAGNNGGFNQGATAFTFNAGGDLLTTLATGTGLNGSGSPATAANLSGSFGQTTTFDLTAAGKTFFTAPVPFYPLNLTSGQLESIQIPTSNSTILVTGTVNANFAPIPEPADLALVGVALLGLGLAVTRRRTL
jgi:hypothetical protein